MLCYAEENELGLLIYDQFTNANPKHLRPGSSPGFCLDGGDKLNFFPVLKEGTKVKTAANYFNFRGVTVREKNFHFIIRIFV